MKPPEFSWMTATSTAECLSALAGDSDGGTKIIAGGQSLIPLMSLGMASPSRLIDITRVHELDALIESPNNVRIGALVSHSRLASSGNDPAPLPLIAMAARHIGHVAIRNRGTLGGSLAHADRAAELPAVMVLLGANISCESYIRGTRSVPAAEFFLGPYTTALEDDEMITQVELLKPATGTVYGFAEFAARQGDFARSGAACSLTLGADGRIEEIRAVIFATTPAPRIVTDDVDTPAGQKVPEVDWQAFSDELTRSVEGRIARRLTSAMLRRAFEQASSTSRGYG